MNEIENIIFQLERQSSAIDNAIEVLRGVSASVVTSKPAIEGHFKTGQRTITLDEPFLPYWLAIWQGQFDPARHSAKLDSSLPLHPPAGEFRRSNHSFLF